MSDKPISPLRQRMIEDMTARRFKGEGTERLRPARQNLCGLSRPFAGCGHERGPSPLSAAFGAKARAKNSWANVSNPPLCLLGFKNPRREAGGDHVQHLRQ